MTIKFYWEKRVKKVYVKLHGQSNHEESDNRLLVIWSKSGSMKYHKEKNVLIKQQQQQQKEKNWKKEGEIRKIN